MKRWKMILLTAAVSSTFLLGGCGTAMYELTDDEQEMIAHYAAHALAKYNVYQKDGMTDASLDDPKKDKRTDDSKKTEETKNEQTTETQTTEQNTDSQGEAQNSGDAQDHAISLADAIGHGNDLSVTYERASIEQTYKSDEISSVAAPNGSVYVVMKFQVTNNGQNDVSVDTLNYGPAFTAQIGDSSVKAELTILTNDFSTYQGTIAAGQTVENVLLFKVPDSITQIPDNVALSVSVSGNTSKVGL